MFGEAKYSCVSPAAAEASSPGDVLDRFKSFIAAKGFMASFKRLFSIFDFDHDGAITLEEFRVGLNNIR